MRSCKLGNECRCLVGDNCTEPGCDFAAPYFKDSALGGGPCLDHSRGQEWWDAYFIGKAQYTAKASRDPSSKCGAVIIRPDKTVASEGFNGFPKGMNDDPARYLNRDDKIKRVLHAEENALTFRKESVQGFTMYIWPYLPCSHCALLVIQSGIKRVVAPPLASHPERWRDDMALAVSYFAECGVTVDEFVGAH